MDSISRVEAVSGLFEGFRASRCAALRRESQTNPRGVHNVFFVFGYTRKPAVSKKSRRLLLDNVPLTEGRGAAWDEL